VPCYRELTERFLGQAPGAMAAWLLPDLERVGAVAVRDGLVRPLAAA